MLRLIAEIGGSSSRWAIIPDQGPVTLAPAKGRRWPGYNPVAGSGAGFAAEMRTILEQEYPEAVRASTVHVYGAGCGTGERKARMVQAMQLICPDAGISVATDLMGAAIGLCGNSAGLVLILGTGMNAGYFDGERMHSPMPSLGYLLGDEASGADIGRHLLQDAFHGRIPPHLHEALFGPDGPVLAQVLEQLHRADHPARELASYTARLADHLDAPYVRDLLQGRFHELAELLGLYFTQDQRRTVHATGSVAYGFRELLAGCLLDHGMTVMAVERDPLPGLVRYHQRQG